MPDYKWTNGGGKTLTLKYFGVVAIMKKLVIPIPIQQRPNKYSNRRSAMTSNGSNNNGSVRVDFFQKYSYKLVIDRI